MGCVSIAHLYLPIFQVFSYQQAEKIIPIIVEEVSTFLEHLRASVVKQVPRILRAYGCVIFLHYFHCCAVDKKNILSQCRKTSKVRQAK